MCPVLSGEYFVKQKLPAQTGCVTCAGSFIMQLLLRSVNVPVLRQFTRVNGGSKPPPYTDCSAVRQIQVYLTIYIVGGGAFDAPFSQSAFAYQRVVEGAGPYTPNYQQINKLAFI